MAKEFILMALLTATLVVAAFPAPIFAQSADPTWVLMVGQIVWVGDLSIPGWCGTLAEIDQWAETHAFWAEYQVLPIPGSYTFHYARLVEASIIKLEYEGNDFYILGEWDVLKITLMYDEEGNITPIYEAIVIGASGELFVTGEWTDFTIAITDIDPIIGKVFFYRIVHDGLIPIGDVRGIENPDLPDGKIDIWDLVHVAKAYGDTPGVGNYYFDIDFNHDFKIDILDLSTLAANLGKSY